MTADDHYMAATVLQVRIYDLLDAGIPMSHSSISDLQGAIAKHRSAAAEIDTQWPPAEDFEERGGTP